MIVAIDRTPTQDANRYRGVGSYTQNLIDEYQKNEWDIDFKYFSQTDPIKEKVDVVHYPYFDPFKPTLPLRAKSKIVVTVHDLIPILFPEKFPKGIRGSIVWLRQKFALSHVDHIVTDSESSKKDILKLLGIKENKVDAILLATDRIFLTDTPKVKWDQKKLGIEGDFILYMGDVNFNKNVNGLIHAFSKLSSGYQLVIAGKAAVNDDLMETKEIVSMVDKLGISDRVKRVGFVSEDDLLQLFKHASLYVQPSFYEGFGLPLLNAMTAGCLAISSNKSSLPEIGGNSVDYFDPSNIDEISQIIGKNLQLSKEAKAKKIQRQKDQAQKFDWHKTALETAKIYIRVMNA